MTATSTVLPANRNVVCSDRSVRLFYAIELFVAVLIANAVILAVLAPHIADPGALLITVT